MGTRDRRVKTKGNSMKRKKSESMKRRSKLTLVNLKVSVTERKLLVQLARKYTKGNLSEWLRKAGKFFKPSRNHLNTL